MSRPVGTADDEVEPGEAKAEEVPQLTAEEIAALDAIAGKVITHLAGQAPTELPPR